MSCVQRDSPPSPSAVDTRCKSAATSSGYAQRRVEASKEDDVTNEQSPLLPSLHDDSIGNVPSLSPILSPGRSSSSDWDLDTVVKEESKSGWYLFLLTISFGGLQIAWSVELSNGSPYLLSLGVTKSLLAFVWIAGPLSGTLAQPYVGVRSDRCRSRFGKRRPFMVGGAIASFMSLMILAWTREIMGGILSVFGVSQDSEGAKTMTIILAVFTIYILDFSVNVVQAAIRAFVVDNAPTHQQASANAWASRLLGIGNIIGYLLGYADLPKYLGYFGNTQFKVLCVIASSAMALTLAISCFFVSERDPRQEGELSGQEAGVIAFFRSLWDSMRRLPPQIKSVCIVQLAAWVGWFPFLFYITTYIGELYVDPIYRKNPNMTDLEIDKAWESGIRVGTFALLVYAIVSFVASVMLPWFIASPEQTLQPPARTPLTVSPSATRPIRVSRAPLTSPASHPSSSSGSFHVPPINRQAGAVDAACTHSIRNVLASHRWLHNLPVAPLQVSWLTLKRAWLLSHVMFGLLMWLTFFAHNVTFATILTGLVGISWAITMWAPFALIATEISKLNQIRRGLIRSPPTRDGELLAQGEGISEGPDQAGVILGIHNVAIAAPQVVATLVSSAIFKLLQKPRGVPGDDSVAWVLRFGGISALVAAWLTRNISEEGEEEGTPPKW